MTLSIVKASYQSLQSVRKAFHDVNPPWLGRLVCNPIAKKLKECHTALDKHMPSNMIQDHLDLAGRKIDGVCKNFFSFINSFLVSPKKLSLRNAAILVIQMPLKVVRNNLFALYQVVKAILNAAVHPLHAQISILELMNSFLQKIQEIENYPKFGAAMLGASITQMLFMDPSYPVAGIGAVLGIGILLTGLMIGFAMTLKVASEGQKSKTIGNIFFEQVLEMAEGFFSGAAMGGLFGLAQNSLIGHQLGNSGSIPRLEVPAPTPLLIQKHKISIEEKLKRLSDFEQMSFV